MTSELPLDPFKAIFGDGYPGCPNSQYTISLKVTTVGPLDYFCAPVRRVFGEVKLPQITHAALGATLGTRISVLSEFRTSCPNKPRSYKGTVKKCLPWSTRLSSPRRFPSVTVTATSEDLKTVVHRLLLTRSELRIHGRRI